MDKKAKIREWAEPTPRNYDKVKKVEEEEIIIPTPPKEVEVVKKKNSNWDVIIGEEITFFDPSLSYEITGYRPITMDKGLDFDPKPFMESGETYKRTGKYCTFPFGTKFYADFWTEQTRRCNEGYTIGNYRITGDHYYFLNFYRLPNVKNYGNSSSPDDFPNFYTKQYEYFHYIELCEVLGYDAAALKSRGIGFSEIAGGLGVRPYITQRQYRVLYTAFTETYLDKVLEKCWKQLEFCNQNTQGGFKRLRQKINQNRFKRSSRKDKAGNESGRMSEIEGIIADAPKKVRGDRCRRLFFEEAGSDPVLIKKYGQAEALVKILGKRIGIRILWGTGGDEGSSLAGLASIFFNPKDYEVLPYKNNYNEKGEWVYTGFFVPAYAFVDDLTDDRGVTNEVLAKEYYEKLRKDKASNPENLLIYKSEYCFTPSDALLREGSNEFDAIRLSEQITNIDLLKNVELPVAGKLLWSLNDDGSQNMNALPIWEPMKTGKLLIAEHPIIDNDGSTYRNLYVAGIDSIDADESSSTGQKNVSDFCIVVKRKQFGMLDPRIVAVYKDRPKDVREAYNMSIKLLQYYNCQAVLESTRVGIITYFKDHKKTNYLMKRPQATLTDIVNGNSNMFGTPATVKVISHYKELIRNFINDYCHTISFREVLDQALRYSDANKKQFDIIAAWGMCELGEEELHDKTPVLRNQSKKEWTSDVGYYFDDYGIKRFGVIPQTNKLKWQLGNLRQ